MVRDDNNYWAIFLGFGLAINMTEANTVFRTACQNCGVNFVLLFFLCGLSSFSFFFFVTYVSDSISSECSSHFFCAQYKTKNLKSTQNIWSQVFEAYKSPDEKRREKEILKDIESSFLITKSEFFEINRLKFWVRRNENDRSVSGSKWTSLACNNVGMR